MSNNRILDCLRKIYKASDAKQTYEEIISRVERFKGEADSSDRPSTPKNLLTERDIFLITYPDQFQETDRVPLKTLKKFLDTQLQDCVSGIHLLPFFPFSSDDGFSVMDYSRVDLSLGTWNDISRISNSYDLAVDVVLNHVSAQNDWFKKFLAGEKPYTDYFICVDPEFDLSNVVRPRSTPLLTPFETHDGLKYVWTTFGEDQIDLNYANPAVLLEMVDILLLYVAKGARILRLDAIAYLWKDLGTTCIHLPQTHQLVKLIRAVLDVTAPQVLLLTETNVPHEENMSYFGEESPDAETSTNEAQLVYQFPLAPLVLHALISGNVTILANWVAQLPSLKPGTAFFNFVASHDGIGIRPAEGYLLDHEIGYLADHVLAHQGMVSYRSDSKGHQRIYEFNITLFDALNNPVMADEEFAVERFMASQVIMLSLAGIPAVYVHSLFGSSNCFTCVQKTGRARSINRGKFNLNELMTKLRQPESKTSRIFEYYRKILKIRQDQPAFHPAAAQKVLGLSPNVLILVRKSCDQKQYILCLVNITGRQETLTLTPAAYDLPATREWMDLISEETFAPHNDQIYCDLSPYQSRWLACRI